MAKKLDRSIGLFSAVNIGIGTMIGSAIFVLVGTSMDLAGPSAFISVGLAGIAAIFTAFSFAELVTVIPTAGGGYVYVKEASHNGVLGFLTGWAFWLGYAMSCGLFAIGFGTFVSYFFQQIGVPFPPSIASYGLIIAFVVINIRGAKNSTEVQNWITSILLLILFAYIGFGIFHIQPDKLTPLFPKGLKGTISSISILYITYIGYGLITTMSEEVKNPEKTIPRSIFISTIIVVGIKTLVFFIAAGIVSWTMLTPTSTNTPMIDTAVILVGPWGGYLFAFAGLLATVSSINTAILASSRTSYALSKDRRFPNAFSTINRFTKTPVLSILMAGLIAAISTSLQNLERISTITALFSLIGYSFVNIAVIQLRKQKPAAKRAFKVPFFPYFPVIGTVINVILIFQLIGSDYASVFSSLGILLLGALYYYILYPRIQNLPKGISPAVLPTITPKSLDYCKDQYNILLPLGNPKTAEALLHMSFMIAKGSLCSAVTPIHVAELPDAIPINSKYTEFKSILNNFEALNTVTQKVSKQYNMETEALLIYSRKRTEAIDHFVKENDVDFTLIGWHKSGLAYNMLNGMVPHLLKSTIPYIGIYRPVQGHTEKIRRILFPYSGGLYCKASASIIKRIAAANNSFVTLLNIVDKDSSFEERIEIQQVFLKSLQSLHVNGEIKTIEKSTMSRTSIIIEASEDYDLLVLGMEAGWGIRESVTGFSTDTVTEHSHCSVLLIREGSLVTNSRFFRRILDSINRI